MPGTAEATADTIGAKPIEFVFPDIDSAIEAYLVFPQSAVTDGRVIRIGAAEFGRVRKRVLASLDRDGFEYVVRRAGRARNVDGGAVPPPLPLAARMLRLLTGTPAARSA